MKKPTMDHVMNGTAVQCWKCDNIDFDDYQLGDPVTMTSCSSCQAEHGVPDPYLFSPYFIVDHTNGMGYAGGVIAFTNESDRDGYAKMLRDKGHNILCCFVQR